MSDRSLGEVLGGGLFWTAVLRFFPAMVGGMFAAMGKFLIWFILLAFAGFFVQVFTGSEKAHKGAVAYEEVEISAVGTLDHLQVTVWNHNTTKEIRFIEFDCGGQNIMLRHVMPGSSKGYSTYAPNIQRGDIQCEFIRVHS